MKSSCLDGLRGKTTLQYFAQYSVVVEMICGQLPNVATLQAQVWHKSSSLLWHWQRVSVLSVCRSACGVATAMTVAHLLPKLITLVRIVSFLPTICTIQSARMIVSHLSTCFEDQRFFNIH